MPRLPKRIRNAQLTELHNKTCEAFRERFKAINCPNCEEDSGIEAQRMQWGNNTLYEPCKKCGYDVVCIANK